LRALVLKVNWWSTEDVALVLALQRFVVSTGPELVLDVLHTPYLLTVPLLRSPTTYIYPTPRHIEIREAVQ